MIHDFFYSWAGSGGNNWLFASSLEQLNMLSNMIFTFAFSVVCYVFTSLALYAMAKRRGLRYYGLAWVPVANAWIMGSLADQFDNFQCGKNVHLRWVLFIGTAFLYVMDIATTILGSDYLQEQILYAGGQGHYVIEIIVLLIFWGLLITYVVFYLMALHKLYYSANPKNKTTFLVLSIFFPVSPFFLFANRNKDLGMIDPATLPPFGDNFEGPPTR